MREATAAEYNRAASHRWATKRIMSGKRYTTIIWTVNGQEVASKTEILKRGKVVETSYMVA